MNAATRSLAVMQHTSSSVKRNSMGHIVHTGMAAVAILFVGVNAAAHAPVVDQGRQATVDAELADVRVAFTPGENIAALIIREIKAARANIRVQAYLFTSKPLADALIAASKRGVGVEIIADANEYSDGRVSALPRLAAQGITVLLNDQHRISHNKIILIDAEQPQYCRHSHCQCIFARMHCLDSP